MDLLNLEKAVKQLNEETIPRFTAAIEKLVDKVDVHIDQDLRDAIEAVHQLLDRINGSCIRIEIPARGEE